MELEPQPEAGPPPQQPTRSDGRAGRRAWGEPRDSDAIVRAWLQEPGAADPVSAAVERGTKKARCHLSNAARSHFGRSMARVASSLGAETRSQRGRDQGRQEMSQQGQAPALSAADDADRELTRAMTSSVAHEGEPPAFDDADALAAYTRNRLQTRCRYLYELLLDDQSKPARAALLPSAGAAGSGRAAQALSIGGCPGFDDVALRVLSSFLALRPGAVSPLHPPPLNKHLQSCCLQLAIADAIAAVHRRRGQWTR